MKRSFSKGNRAECRSLTRSVKAPWPGELVELLETAEGLWSDGETMLPLSLIPSKPPHTTLALPNPHPTGTAEEPLHSASRQLWISAEEFWFSAILRTTFVPISYQICLRFPNCL